MLVLVLFHLQSATHELDGDLPVHPEEWTSSKWHQSAIYATGCGVRLLDMGDAEILNFDGVKPPVDFDGVALDNITPVELPLHLGVVVASDNT